MTLTSNPSCPLNSHSFDFFSLKSTPTTAVRLMRILAIVTHVMTALEQKMMANAWVGVVAICLVDNILSL